MTKDEALKLALEALEGVLDDSPKVLDASISGGLYEVVQCRDAITAIKEALAQPAPVQEPVAWVECETGNNTKRPQNCGTSYCSCIECVMEPEQEPVGYVAENGVVDWNVCAPPILTDLYTTPPQRTWVGLTDKEAMQICVDCGCLSEDWLVLLDAIEAKLKEKNT